MILVSLARTLPQNWKPDATVVEKDGSR